MKKPPLSETQFNQLMPDALNPNGFDVDDGADWSTWAVGSGMACIFVFILIFLNIQLADLIFKGHSAELAQNVSHFLIVMTIICGFFCAYASFKVLYMKNKASKDQGARKAKR
jgi:hypothetical protein